MTGGFSPASIQACYDAIHDRIPGAINAGIYGNKPGYHNCRNQCSPSDYSVQKPDDQAGDGWAGSALDVTMRDPADMKAVTQRLIDATFANDTRLLGLREFFGTVNGWQVTGLDVRGKYWVTSDRSHLWHVHLSFYRKFATDMNACLDIAEVFTGSKGLSEDPMPTRLRMTDHKTKQKLTAGKPKVITFQNAPLDPGGVWAGTGEPAGDYSGVKVSGCPYIATLMLTIDELSSKEAVAVMVNQVDVDSDKSQSGPAGEYRGTSGTTRLTYTRAGNCGEGSKLEFAVNPTEDCTVISAEAFVLYWENK